LLRKLGKKLVFVLFVLVVVLVGVEIGVRIWGYAEHYLYDPIYTEFAAAEDIPFLHKANLRDVRGRGNSRLDTDGLGLRATDLSAPRNPKGPDEFRIAIVGDSVTFGEGVENTADTFCEVLEDLLGQALPDREIAVFNFGVCAYSVHEMAATLRHRIPAVDPDLVVMAVIPLDLDLTRVPVVDKYGYTFNRKLSGFLAKDSPFKRMLRNVRLVYVLRDLRQDWQRRGQAPSRVDFQEVPASYRYLADFAACADERGIAHRIVLLPTFAGHRFGVVEEQLARDGISFLDLTDLVDEFSEDEYLASKFDRHPSAAVHRRIGQVLAEQLLPAISGR